MKKKIDKNNFDDRILFNWGYHDAESDRKKGQLKILSYFGAQNLNHVSHEFNIPYYFGYLHRTEEIQSGIEYTESSQKAWEDRAKYGYAQK
jgi:hypothetical protein